MWTLFRPGGLAQSKSRQNKRQRPTSAHEHDPEFRATNNMPSSIRELSVTKDEIARLGETIMGENMQECRDRLTLTLSKQQVDAKVSLPVPG